MKKRIALLLLSLSLSTYCHAGSFSSEGVSLEVPAGFEEPLSQSNQGATTYAFTKPSTTPSVRTLLQLSVFDTGKPIPRLSKEEMLAASDKYLLDFLKGVERRRTSFMKSEITHISLGGIPASKISWSGNLADLPANGVMYCVIAGNKILSLHTQNAGDHTSPNMLEAIKSIESLVLIKPEPAVAVPTANRTSTPSAEPAAPGEQAKAGKRTQNKQPHSPDLRNCLDLKTNEEIAKCASR